MHRWEKIFLLIFLDLNYLTINDCLQLHSFTCKFHSLIFIWITLMLGLKPREKGWGAYLTYQSHNAKRFSLHPSVPTDYWDIMPGIPQTLYLKFFQSKQGLVCHFSRCSSLYILTISVTPLTCPCPSLHMALGHVLSGWTLPDVPVSGYALPPYLGEIIFPFFLVFIHLVPKL